MDLFGIKRRRAEREAEAQRLADEKAAALKVTLERRKKLIDGYLAHHSDYKIDYLDLYNGRIGYLYRRAKEVLYEGKWPSTSCVCEVYKTVPRMVLEYLTCKWFFSYEGPRENRKKPYQILECPCEERKDREYLFEFSDEVWDIYKRLTKREEYENTDYPESDE